MFKYIHVYVKVDCPYCKDAIDLLEEKEKDYVITVMDKCETFMNGLKAQLNHRTVPVIMECTSDGNTKLIGGFTELKSYFLKEEKKK